MARKKADVEIIASTLRALGYTYPYHQVIGFYLERSGYDIQAQSLFLNFGIKFDFYLEHNMGEMDYSEKWRLFYPEGF